MSAPTRDYSRLSSRPREARAGIHTKTVSEQAVTGSTPLGDRCPLPCAAWVPDHVASRFRVSRLSGMTGERMMTLRAYFLRLAVFYAAGLDFAAAFFSAVGFDLGP